MVSFILWLVWLFLVLLFIQQFRKLFRLFLYVPIPLIGQIFFVSLATLIYVFIIFMPFVIERLFSFWPAYFPLWWPVRLLPWWIIALPSLIPASYFAITDIKNMLNPELFSKRIIEKALSASFWAILLAITAFFVFWMNFYYAR